MKKNNNDKWILRAVLALDCLYGFLTQHERHLCHLNILDRMCNVTDKIIKATCIVQEYNWEPPKSIYGHDRVLYYLVGDQKIPANEYKDAIEEIVITRLIK